MVLKKGFKSLINQTESAYSNSSDDEETPLTQSAGLRRASATTTATAAAAAATATVMRDSGVNASRLSEKSLSKMHLQSSPGDSAVDFSNSTPATGSSDSDHQLGMVKLKYRAIFSKCKVLLLFLIMIVSVGLTIFQSEHTVQFKHYTAGDNYTVFLSIGNLTEHGSDVLSLSLSGPFPLGLPSYRTQNMSLTLKVADKNISEVLLLHIPDSELQAERSEERIITHLFDLNDKDNDVILVGQFFNDSVMPHAAASSSIQLSIETTGNFSFPFSLSYNWLPSLIKAQIVIAAIILLFVYILIIFELVNRTVAPLIGSMMVCAFLAMTNQRPSMAQMVTWLDLETLSLLFGMMILVAIFCETGFFDYCAFLAYKIAKGKVWPLITCLCCFTAIISTVLDNVTTILLFSPVTIRLCQVLNIDPKAILIAEVLFSNIGGTGTAIGDPPNVIIVSNKQIAERNIDFASFTLHMLLGVIVVTAVCYGFLRFQYRKSGQLMEKLPSDVRELKREVEVWRMTAQRLAVYTREEATVKALLAEKALILENRLKTKLYRFNQTEQTDFRHSLLELEQKYRITDRKLLIKCMLVLALVMVLFFTHSFIPVLHLSIGWVAMYGAIALLIMADVHDLETIMHKVEWSTLIFFAALFIMMEGLAEMGLIKFIGDQTASLIRSVDESSRLSLSIILILWVSALASSFIDNIPYTTAMVPIVIQLHEDPSLKLPLQPLVYALAFGACLGGNGTLIGASANVVCAGIADQHGYGFSFVEFFKVGFPMMLVSVLVAMLYLLFCHALLGWH